jgi:ABC-type antimicrobial peptide transport system permease subunit
MKKILLWIGIVVAVLLVIAVVAVKLYLDGAIKSGVEMVGSKLTRVEVKLEKVHLSLLSGSGEINGLVVGNPEGYKTTNAISVGSATLSLQPGSLLSDKIVIRKIEVIAPEITLVGGLSGNNLSKILANLNETTGGHGTRAAAEPATDKAEKKANQKLQVDDFLISGAKVHVDVNVPSVGERSSAVAIDDIHLTNLGTGPDGITSAELTKLILAEIEKEAVKAGEKGASELGRNVLKDLGKSGSGSNLSKGLNELIKKK